MNTAMIYLDSSGNPRVGTTGPDSRPHVNGSQAMAIKFATGKYMPTDSDRIVVMNSSDGGFVYIDLPSAAGIAGRVYTFRNVGSDTAIIQTTDNQKIDQRDFLPLFEREYVTIVSDGSNWSIVRGSS